MSNRYTLTNEQRPQHDPDRDADRRHSDHGALLEMADAFDGYKLMDQMDNPGDAWNEIRYHIPAERGIQQYAGFLKDVKEESRELAPKAEVLLEKLKDYSYQHTKEIDPQVMIQFGQDPELRSGSLMSLSEANQKFLQEDRRQSDYNAVHGNDRTVLTVTYQLH